MAIRIRLVRTGKKNKAFFRIVAVDRKKDGRGDVKEILGHYDPLGDPEIVEIKEERISYWFEKGAIPTQTVKSLCKKKGIFIPPNVDK
ncbi:MAG TPA: 30S ribosomal protein S16 [Candidatus Ratteibacteria bacterium]|nr:30S ribosomal protein S16 [bacterium]HRR96443.1 30S ribosomal protein S16 [Candidatus Ratteibacteria bacterium]